MPVLPMLEPDAQDTIVSITMPKHLAPYMRMLHAADTRYSMQPIEKFILAVLIMRGEEQLTALGMEQIAGELLGVRSAQDAEIEALNNQRKEELTSGIGALIQGVL